MMVGIGGEPVTTGFCQYADTGIMLPYFFDYSAHFFP